MNESEVNESRERAGTEVAIKRRIAKRAAALGAMLSGESTYPNLADQKVANLLSVTRGLMAECALANSWDKAEAASYARAIDFAEAAFEFATSAEPEKASSCGAAKKVCVRECDDEDGYFCYFDCRLEYISCLASVVVGGASVELNRDTRPRSTGPNRMINP